jgi:hypothetical protein
MPAVFPSSGIGVFMLNQLYRLPESQRPKIIRVCLEDPSPTDKLMEKLIEVKKVK